MIVGLAGAKGTGKTTVAQTMRAEFSGGAVCIMSFADPIRDMLVALLRRAGYDEATARALLGDADSKERPLACAQGRSPRYLMQTLGTEWGRRVVSEDLWTGIAESRARAELDSGVALVIFDDVRFEGERAAIERLGGRVFELRRGSVPYADSHVSETPLPFLDADRVLLHEGWGGPRDAASTILRRMGVAE